MQKSLVEQNRLYWLWLKIIGSSKLIYHMIWLRLSFSLMRCFIATKFDWSTVRPMSITYINTLYRYLEPKWPLFWSEKTLFWRVQPGNWGQTGSGMLVTALRFRFTSNFLGDPGHTFCVCSISSWLHPAAYDERWLYISNGGLQPSCSSWN